MNCFVVNLDPLVAARQLCNKHVIKMPLETVQMLCFAFEEGKAPTKNSRKSSHFSHPASQWTRKSSENFNWMLSHGRELVKEYQIRYKRNHACEVHLDWIKNHIGDVSFTNDDLTPFARCFSGFTESLNKTEPDTVSAYRKYYHLDKSSFAKWPSIQNIPDWWLDRSERFVDTSFVGGEYIKR